MRILDGESNKPLNQITLYLTIEEVKKIKDSLEALLNRPRENHQHISSEDFTKEITVCVYDLEDPNLLNSFDERSIKLINFDK